MEGEIEQPTPAPEPEVQQPEHQPDVSPAPANAIDSLSGRTEQPGQTKENPDTLLPAAELRPRMAELEGKIALSGANYSEGEDFYNENGWRAYLEKYGDQGYTFQEIAQHEKLGAEDIKKGIEDGIIKDPKAIQLYGQTKLDSDKQYYTKWALAHIDDEWVQNESKRLIAMTEEECLQLANGKTQDLLQYSNQQGEYRATEAKKATDDEQQAKAYEAASAWYAMAAKLAEQRAKEKKPAETETTDTTFEK